MTNKLEDEFTAYATASFDTGFLFFKVYTVPLNNGKETGQFSLEFRTPYVEYEAIADKKGWLFTAARAYLKHAIAKTTVPMEHWVVEFSPIAEALNIPSHLYLSRAEDCRWLLP